MPIEKETHDKLKAFREKKKFPDSAWRRRGLIPSDPAIVEEMTRLTNICLDELLADAQAHASERRMKRTLIKGLKRFKTSHYDTEEKDFIGDEFFSIGRMVGINIDHALNYWRYGIILGTLIRVTKKKEVILDTKSIACTACNAALNLNITSKLEGVPNYWIIGQCDQCREYNLISTGENAGDFRFDNFKSIEILNGHEYSEEDAGIRLNQIKYFRGGK